MTRSRILVVDDEPQLLRALRNVFRRDLVRWEIVFVDGGPQALEELQRGSFDLVLSDMRMPEVNGLAVLEAVRRDYPYAVRLMLSGSVELEETDAAVAVAHELLAKPCSPAVLRETIERWLRQRRPYATPTLPPLASAT